MAINGTVQATGEFAPTATGDTYAIIDAKYMRDGLRNVDLIADLDNITEDRRIAGMLVGVSGGTTYYKLNPSPWAYDFTDWSELPIGSSFTGNTSGDCISTLYVTDIYGCSPVTIHGSTTGSSNSSFKVRNASTELVSVRDDGYTEFTINGAQSIFGDQSSNYLTHIQNRLEQYSNSASYTGFHANRAGTGISMRAASANNISLIESTGNMTFSTGWDNNFNNVGNLAMLIDGNSQDVGIGLPTNTTIPSARLHVRSTGTTSASASQIWQNGTPTEIARVTDDGGFVVGINTLSGGFANAAKLRVDATVTADYTNSVVFDQTYNNAGNNSNSPATLNTRIYKATTGSTNDMKAAGFQARNDGTGGITYLYGIEPMVWNIGNATINSAFAISARAQIQSGTITNFGGVDISFQELAGSTTITNMYGVFVRTPVNVSATGTPVTNSYGILIQSNTYGVNNYGVYQDGATIKNYFGGSVGVGVDSVALTKLTVQSTGLTNSDIIQRWRDSATVTRMTLSADGILSLTSASDYTVSDLSAAMAVSYEYTGADASVNHVIGISATMPDTNYGAYTTTPIRGYIYGVQTSTGIGVQGKAYLDNAAMGASGIQGHVFGTNFNKCIGVEGLVEMTGSGSTPMYGGKFDSSISTDPSQNVYGIHALARRTTVGEGTFIGGYFKASNGLNNYSLITDGGNAGFGLTAPTALVHVKATGDTSASNAFKVDGATVDNLLTVRNDGNIGINVAPSSGDRVYISAGSGKDGALNIAASNVNTNGYGILVQGSGAGTSMYGIWADIVGGTTDGWAIRGNAGNSGVLNNHGGHFTARNGTTQSIGVYAQVSGGDSINSTESAAVYAANGSTQSTDRKGLWALVVGGVSGGTSYGVKAEIDANGNNAINYGLHSRANGANSGATNYAAWLVADGGSNATNYALVTNGGDSGFGTTTPTDMLHVNGVTGSTQFRLEQSYTPTGSGDTAGNIGSVAWDDTYWYQKTNTGWGRVAWSYAF